MNTPVPGWAWAGIVLLLCGICSVGWWTIRRWIVSVDKKLEVLDTLPCVIDSKKLKPAGGNSVSNPLKCSVQEN